jgi:hypothetical protein
MIMIISRVNSESVIAVQVFDQKKFKRKDQGFLGVVNIQVSSVIDLEAGGDGKQKKKKELPIAFNLSLSP